MARAIIVMGAPVVVQISSDPAPRDDLVDALIKSCSAAVGDPGCVLDRPGLSGPERAHVVVRFSDGLARVRITVDVRGGTTEVREVGFRGEDPATERFSAAGLIAAGLVDLREQSPPPQPAAAPLPPPVDSSAAAPLADVPSPPPAPLPPTPTRPAETNPRHGSVPVELSASALLGWTQVRPWWGAVLQADVALGRSSFFATGSALYMHTWSRSPAGISEERAALGTGAGVAAAVGPVEVRIRAGIELNDLRVSIVQPGTGRSDAGGRLLVGLGAGADLALPVAGAFAVVAGARGAWLGDTTAVTVGGQPVPPVPAWTYGAILGMQARIR